MTKATSEVTASDQLLQPLTLYGIAPHTGRRHIPCTVTATHPAALAKSPQGSTEEAVGTPLSTAASPATSAADGVAPSLGGLRSSRLATPCCCTPWGAGEGCAAAGLHGGGLAPLPGGAEGGTLTPPGGGGSRPRPPVPTSDGFGFGLPELDFLCTGTKKRDSQRDVTAGQRNARPTVLPAYPPGRLLWQRLSQANARQTQT